MYSGCLPGDIRQIDDGVFSETVRAMNPEGHIYCLIRVTIRLIATASHQLALAEGLEEHGLTAIGMHIRHVSRVCYPEEFPTVVGVAYGCIWGQFVEIALGFVLVIFDKYLSEHGHGFSPLGVFFNQLIGVH
jgi:hypothetical protein